MKNKRSRTENFHRRSDIKTLYHLMPGMFSFIFLMILSVLVGCSGGGGGYSNSNPNTSAAVATNPYEQNDVLRKGDALIIRLSGVPTEDEGAFEVKVDEGGQISMPHIGSLAAVGMTTVQLKNKIEMLYKMKRIYTNPNVTILTQQLRFVNVIGEIRAPQRLPYTKDMTALTAIAASGGFTDYSNRRNVKILRRGQVIPFNAQEALRNPSKDIPLLPDDKIQVDRSIF